MTMKCNVGSQRGYWNRKRKNEWNPILTMVELIVWCQCQFLSFDYCTMVMPVIISSRSWAKGIWKLSTTLTAFLQVSNYFKMKVFIEDASMGEGEVYIIFLCSTQTNASVKHDCPLFTLITNTVSVYVYLGDRCGPKYLFFDYFLPISKALMAPEMTIFQCDGLEGRLLVGWGVWGLVFLLFQCSLNW